jgi:hypothetical protein
MIQLSTLTPSEVNYDEKMNLPRDDQEMQLSYRGLTRLKRPDLL